MNNKKFFFFIVLNISPTKSGKILHYAAQLADFLCFSTHKHYPKFSFAGSLLARHKRHHCVYRDNCHWQ